MSFPSFPEVNKLAVVLGFGAAIKASSMIVERCLPNIVSAEKTRAIISHALVGGSAYFATRQWASRSFQISDTTLVGLTIASLTIRCMWPVTKAKPAAPTEGEKVKEEEKKGRQNATADKEKETKEEKRGTGNRSTLTAAPPPSNAASTPAAASKAVAKATPSPTPPSTVPAPTPADAKAAAEARAAAEAQAKAAAAAKAAAEAKAAAASMHKRKEETPVTKWIDSICMSKGMPAVSWIDGWRDGKRLALLLNHYNPESVKLDPSQSDEANLRIAYDAVTKFMGASFVDVDYVGKDSLSTELWLEKIRDKLDPAGSAEKEAAMKEAAMSVRRVIVKPGIKKPTPTPEASSAVVTAKPAAQASVLHAAVTSPQDKVVIALNVLSRQSQAAHTPVQVLAPGAAQSVVQHKSTVEPNLAAAISSPKEKVEIALFGHPSPAARTPQVLPAAAQPVASVQAARAQQKAEYRKSLPTPMQQMTPTAPSNKFGLQRLPPAAAQVSLALSQNQGVASHRRAPSIDVKPITVKSTTEKMAVVVWMESFLPKEVAFVSWTKDWRDGKRLAAILNHFEPDSVKLDLSPTKDEDAKKAQDAANLKIAHAAVAKLGTQCDLMELDDLGYERLSMITYLNALMLQLDPEFVKGLQGN